MAVEVHPSIQVLDNRLRELGTFIEQAFQTQEISDFFYLLCHCICPLLFSIPFLEPLRKNWDQERTKFAHRCHHLETLAIAEVNKTFDKLVQDTLPTSELKQDLNNIEDVLTGKTPYFSPTYYEIAYEGICTFCQKCLSIGQIDIILSLVEIEESQSKRIKCFSFAPHVLKLRDFKEKALNWKTPSNWVIGEELYAAYWAWKTDGSFFSRKGLSSLSHAKCKHSMQKLEQLSAWQEMQRIKKRNATLTTRKPHLYTVGRFSAYLKRLIDQILVLQGQYKPVETNAPISPYSLELQLQPFELRLIVEWEQGGVKRVYVLKRFQGEGEPLKFMKKIFDTAIGEKAFIPHDSNQSAAKLMHQSNIDNTFFNFFFEKRGKEWVVLKNKKFIFTGKEEGDIKLLQEKILELEPANVKFYFD